MRRVTILVVLVVSFFGCSENDPMQENLKNGLAEYKKLRNVNESFLEGYTVQKIAFFEKEKDSLQLVLMLNDNISQELVKKYSLGLHVYTAKKHLPEGKKFLIWDSKPELKQVGKYKYVLKKFNKPIRKIDSLAFFLYDRDGYKGMFGKGIKVRNLGL